MINLLVDEAYAFDYLSILEVKNKKNSNNKDAWLTCFNHLKNQFEIERWSLMINSEEYKQMIYANELTFDAVDKAKNNEVTAQYVDFCNYKRYIAKQKFQEKFFSEKLNEIKIGYDQYKNSCTDSSKK